MESGFLTAMTPPPHLTQTLKAINKYANMPILQYQCHYNPLITVPTPVIRQLTTVMSTLY